MKRNISPSISIYKFPPTAISSITNRVSGMYMTLSFMSICFLSTAFSGVQYEITNKYNKLNENSKKFLNICLLYPMGYHFMGGIRHFIWDAFPGYLTKSLTLKSSKILFVSSIIPTVLLEKKLSEKFNS